MTAANLTKYRTALTALLICAGCAAPPPAVPPVAAKSAAIVTPAPTRTLRISWAQVKYDQTIWPNWSWQIQSSTNLFDWQTVATVPTSQTCYLTPMDKPFEFFRLQ